MTALGQTGPQTTRKLGTGIKKNLYLTAQEQSNFTMDVQITYTSGPAVSLPGDLAFLELTQACAVGGGKPRSMQIDYVAEAEIDPLSKVGFRPILSHKVYLNCLGLIQSIQIDKVLEQIGFPKDVVTFGGGDAASSKAVTASTGSPALVASQQQTQQPTRQQRPRKRR